MASEITAQQKKPPSN